MAGTPTGGGGGDGKKVGIGDSYRHGLERDWGSRNDTIPEADGQCRSYELTCPTRVKALALSGKVCREVRTAGNPVGMYLFRASRSASRLSHIAGLAGSATDGETTCLIHAHKHWL